MVGPTAVVCGGGAIGGGIISGVGRFLYGRDAIHGGYEMLRKESRKLESRKRKLKTDLAAKQPRIDKLKKKKLKVKRKSVAKFVEKYRMDLFTDILFFSFFCFFFFFTVKSLSGQQHPNWVITSTIKLISFTEHALCQKYSLHV